MTNDRVPPLPHMCATCHQALSAVEMTETGEILSWSHGLPVGHKAVPVPSDETEVMKCDFCSAPDPHWQAECTPFVASAGDVAPGVNFDQQDDGLWAACDPCATYIQRGDWARLLYRSEKTFTRKTGVPVGVFVAHMHDRFRHHYTGVITRIPG